MDAYTAVMGFAAWLTIRTESITIGGNNEAGCMVELVKIWAKAHDLDDSLFDVSALMYVDENTPH